MWLTFLRRTFHICIRLEFQKHPSKYFLFSKTSSRRLKEVCSVTLFVFQDVFAILRLQDLFAIRFPKTSSRRLKDVFKTLSRRLQDVFQDVIKTSSRRFQDVFARRLAIMSSRRLQDVFKTSWKTKKCYTEDAFKTSSVRLHQNECFLGYIRARESCRLDKEQSHHISSKTLTCCK